MGSVKLAAPLASLSPAKRALLELKLQQGRAGIGGNMTMSLCDSLSRSPDSRGDHRAALVGEVRSTTAGFEQCEAVI